MTSYFFDNSRILGGAGVRGEGEEALWDVLALPSCLQNLKEQRQMACGWLVNIRQWQIGGMDANRHDETVIGNFRVNLHAMRWTQLQIWIKL